MEDWEWLSQYIKILKIINEEDKINQRSISKMLGISLGETNSLLKGLINKDYISKVKLDKRKVKYELTESAFKLLEDYLHRVKSTKLYFSKEKIHKIKEAVILGVGNKYDFGKLVGFLELEEFRIIDRIIDLLKSNGIEKIVIVNGYEKEYYEQLAKKDASIFCVTNSNYKWTGTINEFLSIS